MSTQSGNWNYPTPVRFGAGRLQELPRACEELAMRRPLLVTDEGLAEFEFVGRAVTLMQDAGLACTFFSHVRPNPSGEDVERGVETYRTSGCDGVVALGGGSALDAAKAIALMAGQTRPLWDFEDKEDWYTRADVAGIAPIVAIPTTSGTGSEVGRCSVILDRAVGVKKIIFHPRMLPERVICDPELTLSLPPRLTGAVGMDALSHNLEAYCAPGYHPLADGIAVEGIRLVHVALRQAVEHGSDLEARSQMMAASLMGATAFQKGLGAMHALTHPVNAVLDTHHGLTIAVVMPYVLTFNRPTIEDRIAALARYLGLGEPTFDAFAHWIGSLRHELEIPETLAELGVSAPLIPDLARKAAVDPTAPTNPVALTESNLTALYRSACTGSHSPAH